jgi:hypothetical protein
MRYRKTFTEAFKEVWSKAIKEQEDPDRDPSAKESDPTKSNDKKDNGDETVDGLKAQVLLLKQKYMLIKQKLENEKNKVVKPEPNKDTGEVPLRTGIAQAILDKNTPKPKAKKAKKEKVSIGKGQTKIEVDPEVEMGIHSGGATVDTGNLH